MPAVRRAALSLVCLLTCLAGGATARADVMPPIRHVFVIVLENKDYDESFGPTSAAPYLAKTLTTQGQLLRQYYGTSHVSLGNYITMISGQAPNPDTQGDCMAGFKDVFPGVMGPDGQVMGAGCVYPAAAKTVADQLEAKGLTWRAYLEDMGADPAREKAACAHPDIGQNDPTQSASPNDQYATRHNPFVYFHSIIDDQGRCDAHDVNLNELGPDLDTASATPNFVFITPDLCSDGHDATCANPAQKGGLAGVDDFLRTWVPRIQAAPAYKEGSMIVVTWDEGNSPRPQSSQNCCKEPTGPNTPSPGIVGPGGGRTGTVVLSQFTAPGSVNDTPYNHYSLLRSIEDIFGLGHLGYAGQSGLKAFGSDVFGAAPTLDLTGPATSRAPCTLRPLRARGGRVAIGSVISSVGVIRRKGRRPVLSITTSRRARLYVRETGRRRAHAIRARRCAAVRVTLRRAHGRASVTASVRQGAERRAVIY
jgi:phosphatidylinositol-3-phosphatase